MVPVKVILMLRPGAWIRVLVLSLLASSGLSACSSAPEPTNGTGGTVGGTGSGGSSGGATGGARGGGPGTGGSGTGGAGTGGAVGGTGGGAGTAGTGGSGAGGAGGSPTGGGGAPADAAQADSGTMMPAPDMALPVCNYPTWNRTTDYKVGDIVMHMGKAYVAVNASKSLDPAISTYFWKPFTGCVPPAPPPAAKCPALDRLLPGGEETFKAMFTPVWMGWVPLQAYSYASLCAAMAKPGLAGFAVSDDLTAARRELAAFFANVAVETAYLTAIDERGHQASDRTYHGRGALQITGQAIYAEAGRALGLDLAGQPMLGSTEGVVWQTGIWYWMSHANPSVGGAQICHQAIAQSDFGKTIRIIKGDCASQPDRAMQYLKNCTLLGIPPGKTSCP
jgi:predicted chitinase